MSPLTIQSRLPLNNGSSIPLLGLGVFASTTCTQACLTSFSEGYRHIDTAQDYLNEAEVGAAIHASPLPRSSLYITTKVWDTDHTYALTTSAVTASLERMHLDYIDLYLIHNPRSGPTGRHQTWLALQDAVKAGTVKSIGVSNFTPAHLDTLMKSDGVTVKPALNQIEFHPWNQQREIVAYCRRQGIPVQSCTPLAQGKKLGDPVIGGIADKHKKTAAQVVLRWVLQQGMIVIPKSENPGRIKENADIYDFELDEEDLAKVAGLDRGQEGNVGMWAPFDHE